MNEILLAGCTSTPLANYLKALGVFRLVAEQKDPGIKAFWRGERFVLTTHLADLNLTEKPNPDTKPRALLALRARASNEFLTWLYAAVVLSAGEPAYPPLLGTGGNDGRLDFTNNQVRWGGRTPHRASQPTRASIHGISS